MWSAAGKLSTGAKLGGSRLRLRPGIVAILSHLLHFPLSLYTLTFYLYSDDALDRPMDGKVGGVGSRGDPICYNDLCFLETLERRCHSVLADMRMLVDMISVTRLYGAPSFVVRSLE